MSDAATLLRDSATTVASLGSDVAYVQGLTDAGLLAAQESIATHRQHLDTYAAWVAGEIARRSDRTHGGTFASGGGYPDAVKLIQSVSKVTRGEAVSLIQVGTMMATITAAENLQATHPDLGAEVVMPWQTSLGHAVTDGVLSVAAADAIRAGLGDTAARVTADALAAAAAQLIEDAASLTVGQLHKRAREARDDLDEAGIVDRVRHQCAIQSIKAWRRNDGMVQGTFLYAPIPGDFILAVLDETTSPRRGGARFVNPDDQARAERLLADPRSDEQIRADGFITLLRAGAAIDPSTVLGSRRPAVRIIVTQNTLTAADASTGGRAGDTGAANGDDRRVGHGMIEGSNEPVTLSTIDQELCDTGSVTVTLDPDGQCVNVGRTQRLFTTRQRVGLGVRDGGCRWPGCERPPSWCEAHHVQHWKRDNGQTNIADGVLLCRFHHLLLHNNEWNIRRDNATYWLTPPRTVDRQRVPILMPSKSPLIRTRLSDTIQARLDDTARKRAAAGKGTPAHSGRTHPTEQQSKGP